MTAGQRGAAIRRQRDCIRLGPNADRTQGMTANEIDRGDAARARVHDERHGVACPGHGGGTRRRVVRRARPVEHVVDRLGVPIVARQRPET